MARVTGRATRATFWSASEIAVRYGMQMAVTIVLARLLTPADFGMIAIILVFTSFGALLTDASFGTALIQRRHIHDDDKTTVFVVTLTTGFVTAAILWACAGPIADFYHLPMLLPVAHVVAWMLPLGALGVVPDALLTRNLDFQRRTQAQVCSSLLSALAAIVLALCGQGVWSLAWQSLIEISVRSLLLWLLSKWRPRGRFRSASLRNLFGFGGYLLLSGLLSTVSTRIQALLIGKLFSAGEVGYYSLAQNAPMAPANFIGATLNRVGLPMFSSMAGDSARLRSALQMTLQVSMFVFLPCMVGMALLARPLIEWLYGAQWLPAAPMLALLALAASLWPLHVLNLVALTAQGRSDLYFRLEVVKNFVTVAATLLVASRGPNAVAAAMLFASLGSAIINMWYSGRLLGYGPVAQWRDQFKTLLITSLAALPAFLLLHYLPPSLAIYFVATGVAALTYLATAGLLRHPALPRLRDLADHAMHPLSAPGETP